MTDRFLPLASETLAGKLIVPNKLASATCLSARSCRKTSSVCVENIGCSFRRAHRDALGVAASDGHFSESVEEYEQR
jgi:hypothetical protein